MPKYGVLRFDYVSTSRPEGDEIPLSERRFQVCIAGLIQAVPSVNFVYVLERGIIVCTNLDARVFFAGTEKISLVTLRAVVAR